MPECRFCLETGSDFIRPCDCKGSVEYIHRYCLYHWMNVSGSSHCSICSGRFRSELEDIPRKDMHDFILSSPMILLLIVHYICIFFLSERVYTDDILHKYVLTAQTVFHIFYAGIFAVNFRVKRLKDYWAVAREKYWFIIYHAVCLVLLFRGCTALSIPIAQTMHYWKFHKEALAESNRRFTKIGS